MKKFLLPLLLFCAILSTMAQTIYTSASNFRGHLQGLAVDATGIYCSFAYEMAKFD